MNSKLMVWVDIVLFGAFIGAFFLELSGIALHQWIGILTGLLAGYHLVSHWNWVKAVTRRLFGKTASQSRLYYLVDALLAAGLAGIIGTGLMISSWINLPLSNYDTWRTFHIGASIVTLAATVVKIGLHWRWIALQVRTMLPKVTPVQPVGRHVPAGARQVTRRDLLKIMGVAGIASFLAMEQSIQSLAFSTSSTSSSASSGIPSTVVQANTSDSPVIAQTANTSTSTSTSSVSTVQTNGVNPTTATATTATVAPTATTAAVVSAATSSCTVLCNKGCSFPGRCRRYVDTNGNNRCDRGECL